MQKFLQSAPLGQRTNMFYYVTREELQSAPLGQKTNMFYYVTREEL